MPGAVLNALKKLLSARVELRIVTISILLALAALGFGAFMKDGAERSIPRGGALGRLAFRIGSTPQNLYRRFFGVPGLPRPDGLSREQRFHGRGGLIFAKSPPPPPEWRGKSGRPGSGISGHCAPSPFPGEGGR